MFGLGVACIAAGFFTKKPVAVAGFCLFFLVLGILRLQIVDFVMARDAVSKLNDKSEKITLTGVIIAEPDVRLSFQKLRVKIDKTESVVLVTTNRYPDYHYLDALEITGKVKTPAVVPARRGGGEDFDYKQYLAKEGIYSVMDFPTVTITSQEHQHNPLSFVYEKILFIKGRLVESVHMNFSPPHSLILEGMIFGNDKSMSEALKNQFNDTGLSHVTAVSGTNIVILINMLMIFLLAIGLWRGQAFWAAMALIWLYIIMIGFPVSGVRAAIMGSVGLAAQKFGRQNTSSRVLTLTASAMLLQNPMLLVYDVSFQLSFLASLGIIYVKPLIDYYFAVIPLKQLKWLLDIASVTFAAQIITLPIIVYNFGRVSLISPVSNVLALPVVEALTVLGFVTSVAGAFSNILGFIFSLPCLALLWYFTTILNIFSGPWAVKNVGQVSAIWVVVYYALLPLAIIWVRKHQQRFLG